MRVLSGFWRLPVKIGVVLDTNAMERLRRERGLTQAQAAAKAGLAGGRQKWNDIINGRKSNVTMATLDKLAKALGCRPKDLVK